MSNKYKLNKQKYNKVNHVISRIFNYMNTKNNKCNFNNNNSINKCHNHKIQYHHSINSYNHKLPSQFLNNIINNCKHHLHNLIYKYLHKYKNSLDMLMMIGRNNSNY